MNPEQLKLANEYYKWTTLKTNLILNEKSFQDTTTPEHHQAVSNGFARKSRLLYQNTTVMIGNRYICYFCQKTECSCEDIEMIARSLVLIRKNNMGRFWLQHRH